MSSRRSSSNRGPLNPAFAAAQRVQQRGGAACAPSASLQAIVKAARASGTLSASNRSLLEMPLEGLLLDDPSAVAASGVGVGEDERPWEWVPVSRMDCSHNRIQAIPPTIGRFAETLLSLKMSNNELRGGDALPDALYDLALLRSLDVSSNGITALSPRIAALVDLKDLNVSKNALRALPDELPAGLEHLRLEGNQVAELPPSLGALRDLCTLSAGSNGLRRVPAEALAGLAKLEVLELADNALAALPPTTEGLRSLQLLDVRQNQLQALPRLPPCDSTGGSGSSSGGGRGSNSRRCLARVFASYNRIGPTIEAGQLSGSSSSRSSAGGGATADAASALVHLDLANNKLAELPADVCLCTGLKTLDVANNDLSDLPVGLGYLTELQHVVIPGNPLRKLKRSLVTAGAEALKKHLRSRGPPPPGLRTTLADDYYREHPEEAAAALGGGGGGVGGGGGGSASRGGGRRGSRLAFGSGSALEEAMLRAETSGLMELGGLGLDALPYDAMELARGASDAAATAAAAAAAEGKGGGREERGSYGQRGRGDRSAAPFRTDDADDRRQEPGGDEEPAASQVNTTPVWRLGLANNNLQRLPDGFGACFTALQHLDLSSNRMAALPPELAAVPLKVLVVSKNGLRDDGLAALGAALLAAAAGAATSSSSSSSSYGGGGGGVAMTMGGKGLAATLETLDLSENRLQSLPRELMEACGMAGGRLREVLVPYNALTAPLDRVDWRHCPTLETLNLSNNRLPSSGLDRCAALWAAHCPRLGYLNLENNDLQAIPPALALCTPKREDGGGSGGGGGGSGGALKVLLVAGNPQRAIRPHVVAQGSEAVIEALWNKLPPQERTLSAAAAAAAAATASAASTVRAPQPQPPKPSAPFHDRRPGRGHPQQQQQQRQQQWGGSQMTAVAADNTLAAAAAAGGGAGGIPSPAVVAAQGGSSGSGLDLAALEAEIAELEHMMDGPSISSAKRYALKKEMQKKRAVKIKEERRLRQLQQQ